MCFKMARSGSQNVFCEWFSGTPQSFLSRSRCWRTWGPGCWLAVCLSGRLQGLLTVSGVFELGPGSYVSTLALFLHAAHPHRVGPGEHLSCFLFQKAYGDVRNISGSIKVANVRCACGRALILFSGRHTLLLFCPFSHTLTLCLMGVTRPATSPDWPCCSNKTLCVCPSLRVCVCVCVCVHVNDAVLSSSSHLIYQSGVEKRHKGAGTPDSPAFVFLFESSFLYKIAFLLYHYRYSNIFWPQ